MLDGKDRAIPCGYSLRRSQHDALRLIAAHAGHRNKTRVLDQIVEGYLQQTFGRQWPDTIGPTLDQLTAEAAQRKALVG